MGPNWKLLNHTVHGGGALRKNSTDVIEAITDWHQEQRDICLKLSRSQGCFVTVKMSRAHTQDQSKRISDDCAHLADTATLSCVLDIPGTAGPVEFVADMRRRNLSCLMRLDAPQDKKRPLARVNWILRQLSKCKNAEMFLRVVWPGRSNDTFGRLSDVIADNTSILISNKSLSPKSFEVIFARDIGAKFAGPKTFIEHVEKVIPEFYENIGQHLRAWAPRPPKFDLDSSEIGTESRVSTESPSTGKPTENGLVQQSNSSQTCDPPPPERETEPSAPG